jgi:uncharacterized membrane protein
MSKNSGDPACPGTPSGSIEFTLTMPRQETATLQQAVDRVTALVGWPGFVGVLTLGIGLWIAANSVALILGSRPADPPPFFWLQSAIATGAFVVATLIFNTQRREDKLARHQSQLILEILVLND